MMNATVLQDSWFDADPTKHGGHRRTTQIFELVMRAGLSITDIDHTVVSNRWQRLMAGLTCVLGYRFSIYPSYRSLMSCGQQYYCYRHALAPCRQDSNPNGLVLWEATNNHVLPHVAKATGLAIVALPQNLESVVPEQVDLYTQEQLPKSFEREIAHLAMANRVFCISREEQWLLRLWGIDADFLPYYPPEAVLAELALVRSARLSMPAAGNDRLLILGSATNPTTRIGMIEQLQWLDRCYHQVPFHVDVVGYGTEALKDLCTASYVTLHGSVGQTHLHQLLTRTKAVLIHQQAAPGAITRIPEMLIAGVPVIASAIACRSAHSYQGVYCYDDVKALTHWLVSDLSCPEVLPPPIVDETRFITYLYQLLNASL